MADRPVRSIMRPMIAALFVALPSCGGPDSNNPFAGADPGNTASIIVAGVDYGNLYSAGLARGSPAERGSVLAQAVRSTNRRCSSVTRADYKGAFERRAFWAVDCGAGGDYLITIADDGAVKGETCALQAANGPGCWVEW